ncbi:MAG: capsule assembly Wzi family protein [Carboxylicivirga sp.]|nr:capsule assembly Wzi family protein [Carboxylicivirga sp.]
MNIQRRVLLILTVFISIGLQAQINQLKIDVASHTLVSSDDIRPMWLVSNEWGRFEQLGQSESLLELGVKFNIVSNDNFKLQAGLRGLVNFEISKSHLQEAYINGKLWFIDYSIGKKQYSPLIYGDHLSSGMFLMNSNARPLPRATLGIFDYMPLGFTKNWLEIKGGMSQGLLNDDRGDKGNSANDVLLHEKFAYARLGNTKLKPYVGLVHSALFGGTRPNGDKIPIDFWATFFAKGSAKLGGGEQTNAAGAHMGMWDFGLDWNHNLADVHFYLQKPFADGSGLFINHGQNKDYILGVSIYPKEVKWLKGLSVELIKTDYQSGEGIPDPVYPDGYEKQGIILMDQIGDYDQFMMDVFGKETSGWTENDVIDYMVINENYGHEYGGRDDFMNNGTYYNGWIYDGMNMGTPLYHTANIVRRYVSSWQEVNQVNFFNNRVNGFHFGAEGYLSPSLKYRIKTTYTLNKGTYGEKYRGRYSWDLTDNYYFSNPKKQIYSMIQLDWQSHWMQGLIFRGKLAIDTGELYNSVGGQLSIVYSPRF